MLHPDWLIENLDEVTEMYSDFHTDLLKSIAKHMKDTLETTKELGVMPSLKTLIDRAQAAGLLRKDIIAHIANVLEVSKKEISDLFDSAAVETIRYDNEIYRDAGLPDLIVRQSPEMQRLLEAGINKHRGYLHRLTGTIATNSEELFERTLNSAYNKVVTGTHSYGSALKEGIEAMLNEGVTVFNYESGRAISVEAALLMNIRTGVGQTAGQITKQGMIEQGCCYLETSAHMGARNIGEGHRNHESWQGQVFYWKELDSGDELKLDRDHDNQQKYANRVNDLLALATPGIGDITYEKGAKASNKELNTYHWIRDNIGGDIKVLAERNVNGVKNPDAEWRGTLLDVKHTSGTIGTLSKQIQVAMRQTSNGSTIVDISGSAYSDEEAINVAIRRMSRHKSGFAILVRGGKLVGHINKATGPSSK